MKNSYNPIVTGIGDLRRIVEVAATYGIKPDKAVAHGIKVYDSIHARTATAPMPTLLDLTEEQILDHAFHLARIYATDARGISAASTASTQVQDRIIRETWEVLVADAPRIIDGLRPAFDKAAAALTDAIKAGITHHSTPQDVLDLEDGQAAVIWNNLPQHINVLERVKDLRALMSQKLGIEPQRPYNPDPFVDYTSCFAHPESGVKSGAIIVYPNNAIGQKEFRTPLQEWLTLAHITDCNMALS